MVAPYPSLRVSRSREEDRSFNIDAFRTIKAVQILVLSLACIPAAHSQGLRLLPFQARLPDSAGKPLADGANVVHLQIFNQPSAGTPVWAGEVHRFTVNGGLFNVSLGTKNPFPMDRTNKFSAVVGLVPALPSGSSGCGSRTHDCRHCSIADGQ